jgi:hypothetical protein
MAVSWGRGPRSGVPPDRISTAGAAGRRTISRPVKPTSPPTAPHAPRRAKRGEAHPSSGCSCTPGLLSSLRTLMPSARPGGSPSSTPSGYA